MKIPTICRYCGGRVKLTTAREIYDKSDETIYLCTNCNAYVGCHKGTNRPLGKLANAMLRLKRRETHDTFDLFWRSRGWTRNQAYIWLARTMCLKNDNAHIGNFEMDECEQVIQLCRSFAATEVA